MRFDIVVAPGGQDAAAFVDERLLGWDTALDIEVVGVDDADVADTVEPLLRGACTLADLHPRVVGAPVVGDQEQRIARDRLELSALDLPLFDRRSLGEIAEHEPRVVEPRRQRVRLLAEGFGDPIIAEVVDIDFVVADLTHDPDFADGARDIVDVVQNPGPGVVAPVFRANPRARLPCGQAANERLVLLEEAGNLDGAAVRQIAEMLVANVSVAFAEQHHNRIGHGWRRVPRLGPTVVLRLEDPSNFRRANLAYYVRHVMPPLLPMDAATGASPRGRGRASARRAPPCRAWRSAAIPRNTPA